MPKKLTKDQKYNQKLRKEGQKDFKRVPREGKTASKRVTRRALCVRVSTETAERLKAMADDAGVHLWQMSTRIIHLGIPGYDYGSGYQVFNPSTGKYESYEHDESKPSRYKGETGDVQLNLRINSTAWNKLHAYSSDVKVRQSKARVFQRLVLEHKPLTKEQREKQEQRRREQQEYYAEWNGLAKQPSEKPKFKIDNYEIIHVKGIPVELWDDAEWEEYERLQADVEQRMEEKLNGD